MHKFFLCYWLIEASNIRYESSSDDDASSETSYSSDIEDCSETSDSESENTLSKVQQPGKW